MCGGNGTAADAMIRECVNRPDESMQSGGNQTRRVIGRCYGRKNFVRGADSYRLHKIRRARQNRRYWQHETDGRHENVGLCLAAGHGALAHFIAVLVLAGHRFFRSARCRMVLPLRVVRRQTNSAVAATHLRRLPRHGPQWRPQQHCRNQAQPRTHFSSRSDKKWTQILHSDSESYRSFVAGVSFSCQFCLWSADPPIWLYWTYLVGSLFLDLPAARSHTP